MEMKNVSNTVLLDYSFPVIISLARKIKRWHSISGGEQTGHLYTLNYEDLLPSFYYF